MFASRSESVFCMTSCWALSCSISVRICSPSLEVVTHPPASPTITSAHATSQARPEGAPLPVQCVMLIFCVILRDKK